MYRVKILAELVKKFPGLSKEFLGFIASKLEPKVTEETQIEGVINELDNSPISIPDQAGFFQKESDRRVTEAQTKWKKENPIPPSKKKKGEDDPEEDDENEPATGTAAAIKKLQEDLDKRFAELDKKSLQVSLTEKLHTKLKEKKIPLVLAKGRNVESEEALEALVAEIEADHLEIRQGLSDQGLQELSGSPILGQMDKEGVSSATKAYVENKIKPTAGSDLGGKKV